MDLIKPYEIIVVSENVNEFNSVYAAIRNFTDCKSDVPYFLIMRFFELLYDLNKYKKDQLFRESQSFSSIAFEKLKSNEDYQFNWVDTNMEGNGMVIKNDSYKIFTELIHAFNLYRKDHQYLDKNDAITFFYQAFEISYKLRMDENSRNSFSSYKQSVICGVLTMAIGFQITTIKNPTNEEIYQATRYAIKKYLKEE